MHSKIHGICSLGLSVNAAPDDYSVSHGCHSIDALSPMLGNQTTIENVQAAILYERSTQTLMYSYNADTRVDPASIVKVMTALIAVESGKLSDMVTVKASVLETVPDNAVSVDLQEGEQISLRDLVYCMMIGSGNDAAAVIAEYVAGDAFVDLMNTRAQEIGCIDTQFTNAHGIYDENQYSTARDLTRIVDVALQNEDFVAIFGTTHHTVTATNKSEPRELLTNNHLMHTDTFDIYFDERVTGGRAGTAGDDTRCMAVTAEKNGLHMISIVLGSESVYDEDNGSVRSYGGFYETKKLLDLGFEGFKTAQILYEGMVLKRIPYNENYISAATNAAFSSVLPANATEKDLRFEYVDTVGEATAQIEKGQVVSTVRVWYGSLCISQADLYALHNVNAEDLNWSRDNVVPSTLPETILTVVLWLFAIAAVVVAIVVILVIVKRKKRKKGVDSREHRYGSNRRRMR